MRAWTRRAVAVLALTMLTVSMARAAVITVGSGDEYATLSAALPFANPGDTIEVAAGTYLEEEDVITTPYLTIEGVGGLAVFDHTADSIGNRQGILVVSVPIIIENMEFLGASVPDANGAGIRVKAGGVVTVDNSEFVNDQDGILGDSDPSISITVNNSSFIGDGAACSGFAHGLYAAGGSSLTVNGDFFENTCVGHDIQSRAATTTVLDSVFDECSLASTTSYQVNVANGGVAVIEGNQFCKGPNAQNEKFISYDPGGYLYSTNSLTVEDNSFVGPPNLYDPTPPYPIGIGGPTIGVYNFSNIHNPSDPIVADVEDNTFTCVAEDTGGSATLSGNVSYPCPEPGTLSLIAPPVLWCFMLRRKTAWATFRPRVLAKAWRAVLRYAQAAGRSMGRCAATLPA
jgi:hypothetical protein